MTPSGGAEGYARGAWRGAVEGAALGVVLVVFRLARLWLGGADAEGFGDHQGEVWLYSSIVVAVMASIFGVGRAISGGWIGSLAGATALGLGGLAIGARSLPPTAGPPGLLGLLGVGGLAGAFVGAIVERLVWQRRGGPQGRDTPEGDGPA